MARLWKKLKRRAVLFFLDCVERLESGFITYLSRPKNVELIGIASDPVQAGKRLAVVLQGPVRLQDNFTVDTVKLYKKTFPNSIIVISTWVGEDPAALAKLAGLGAVVVTSQPPKFSGTAHINNQIISSLQGLLKAKELGAEYILKSRTDMRMHAVNLEEFLPALLQAFPVAPGFAQRKRILGFSMNTMKYRPYHLSDMLVFGTTEDMENYWSAPLDDRLVDVTLAKTTGDFTKLRVCEVYLASHFLQKVGRKLSWTVEDWWAAARDNLVIADASVFDIYWPKYESKKEYRYRSYDRVRNFQELNFKEWLILFSSFSNKANFPERALQAGVDDPVPF